MYSQWFPLHSTDRLFEKAANDIISIFHVDVSFYAFKSEIDSMATMRKNYPKLFLFMK